MKVMDKIYVWIALLFSEDFQNYIRENAKPIGIANNLDFVAFTLPQHVSLKISFPCRESDFLSISEELEKYFSSVDPFIIEFEEIELVKGNNNIIWINIKENNYLRKMHNDINAKLLDDYNIGLSGYDGEEFRFHSTLFTDDKSVSYESYEKAFNSLRDLPCDRRQIIDKACIGFSKSGKMGEYEVYKTFNYSSDELKRM